MLRLTTRRRAWQTFLFCFYGCFIQLDNAAQFTMLNCMPLTGIVLLKFYIKLCCEPHRCFYRFCVLYLTWPLQICQQCCCCCYNYNALHNDMFTRR